MKRRPFTLIPLLCLSAFGCGGANESYLPKPRPPEPDEPAVASPAVAKPAPAGFTTRPAVPAAAAPPASSLPPPTTATASTGSAQSAPPTSHEERSEVDRRRRVVSQLTRIGQALEAYRAKKGCYPARSAFAGQLSWRVALLPYLGHEDLCARFDKEERWDHPNNRTLLSHIPEVFQADDRRDGKTNLVLLTGPQTASAAAVGLRAEQFLDGPENTVLIVEVDDAHAVPWTAAEDCEFQPATLQAALFGKRKDCCYALFGGTTGVRRIPANLADDQFLALVTPSGGEAVAVNQLTSSPHPDVDAQLIQQLDERSLARFTPCGVSASETENSSTGASNGLPGPPARAGMTASEVADGAAGGGSQSAGLPAKVPGADQRIPVPEELALERAAALVREVYGVEYEAAKNLQQRRALAKKMLDEAHLPAADPAGLFVLYRSARDIAAQAGDLDTSFQASRLMAEAFQINPLPAEREIVERAAAEMQSAEDWKSLCDHALRVGDQTLAEDDFMGSQRLYSLALSAARQARCRDRLGRVYQKQELGKATQLAYHRVSRQMHLLLRAPDDAAANGAVGRYLALVKRNWERGLPMLARGDDDTLGPLAQRELRSAATPDEQVQVADGWWDWSAQAVGQLERDSARQRAGQWYRRVLPLLPTGLLMARIEKRLASLPPNHDDAGLAALVRGDD